MIPMAFFAATLLFLIVRRRQIPHPVITPDGGFAWCHVRYLSGIFILAEEALDIQQNHAVL